MRRRNHSVRQFFAFALAGVLALQVGFPAAVSATETEDTAGTEEELSAQEPVVETSGSTRKIERTTGADADALPDSEELFAEYADRVFYGDTVISTLANYGEKMLDEKGLLVYTQLKEMLAEVADGERVSTFFELDTAGLTWTAEELGSTSIDDLVDTVIDMLFEVHDCLLVDCPYELYWYDKTQGYSIGFVLETDTGDDVDFFYTAEVTEVCFEWSVSVDYQGEDDTTVDTAKTSAAVHAAANAKEIAAEYDSLSDREKVEKYKEEICALVSYDFDAAEDPDMPYGNPWQIIYVFDENPETSVVCEGYAKAFQYLCDLGLTDAVSYIVTGYAESPNGSAGHMWNILNLEGCNYLVDVTSSDEGGSGENGGLFLVDDTDAENMVPAREYRFVVNDRGITYTYDEDTIALYGDSILTLGTTHALHFTEQPADRTLTYGDVGETLSVCAETDSGAISYQWYQKKEGGAETPVDGATDSTFEIPADLPAGSTTYYCNAIQTIRHTGGDEDEEVSSSEAVVTVNKRDVTVTIEDAEKKAGEENPAFTWKITEGALVNGDDESALGITLSTDAKTDSGAGIYTISGTAESENYNVSFVFGMLLITQEETSGQPTQPGTVQSSGGGTDAGGSTGDSGSGNIGAGAGTEDKGTENTDAVKTADTGHFGLWIVLWIACGAVVVSGFSIRRRNLF